MQIHFTIYIDFLDVDQPISDTGNASNQPTKVYSHFWIHEEDPKIVEKCELTCKAWQWAACEKCPFPEWKLGQWMMFFDNSVIDEKWEKAVKLYRQGKLTGVSFMKVICNYVIDVTKY